MPMGRRPSGDDRVAHDPYILSARQLREPGWIDPDYLSVLNSISAQSCINAVVSSSILLDESKRSRVRSRHGDPLRTDHLSFVGQNKKTVVVDRTFFVRFLDSPEVRIFEVDDPDSASVWKSCKRSSKIGSPFNSYYKRSSFSVPKSSPDSVRHAIARAVSMQPHRYAAR